MLMDKKGGTKALCKEPTLHPSPPAALLRLGRVCALSRTFQTPLSHGAALVQGQGRDRGPPGAQLQVKASGRALGLCSFLLSAYLFHLLNEIQFEAININALR